MRFLSSLLIAVTALTVQVTSIPTTNTRRQSSVQVVQQYVNECSSAVNGDMDNLNTAVANSENDVSAQVELVATAKADLGDIASQFSNYAASLEASTSSLATTLTEPEVIVLTEALEAADTLINSLINSYIAAAEVFTADSKATVQNEASAAAEAVQLFSAPLVSYAGQVQQIASSDGSSSMASLNAAASSLSGDSKRFLAAAAGVDE